MLSKKKAEAVQEKLREFLNKSPEELQAIDTDTKYDGLFDTIDEISDVVEECCKPYKAQPKEN